MPRFWREMAAAAIDPAAGFNRLAFGSPTAPVFSSRNAAYFSSLQVGYSGNVERTVGGSAVDLKRNAAQIGFAIDYGLPPGFPSDPGETLEIQKATSVSQWHEF